MIFGVFAGTAIRPAWTRMRVRSRSVSMELAKSTLLPEPRSSSSPARASSAATTATRSAEYVVRTAKSVRQAGSGRSPSK